MSEATFGEALRRYRLAAGLSQEELAERAALSVKAIGTLERGERRYPYPHTIRALADALGLGERERAALLASGARRSAYTALPQPANLTQPHRTATLTSLPPQLSTLIGREIEVSVARQLLARPGVRLLTLTGPGGAGKTRLALRLAEEVAADFPDGIVFVPLASVADPALVLDTIARTLGTPEVADTPPLEAVAAALQGGRILLVLDNFEHLLAATTALSTLLAACAELTILVTSRAGLRLRGEQEYRVPPLDLPRPGDTTPDLALASDAVRLFVARAREHQADFTLTPANVAAVVAICRRLDGLPLALELAAARIRLLAPAALLARLDQTLPLLADGPRDLPDRQRTMRDAITWSYELLPAEERRIFARLAAFVGSTTLDACEVVCTDDGGEPFTTLERVAVLLDNNLVVREAATDAEEAHGPRIRLLEPIREFAAEQLAASGEERALRLRHARYYLGLAERARTDQREWLRQVGAAYDNLQAALRWTLREEGEAEEATLGLRLTAALWWFWDLRGRLAEGRAWIERALRLDPGLAPSARAEALNGAGEIVSRQRDYTAAAAFDEECLALCRALSDAPGIARALTSLAEMAMRTGDLARASALLVPGLELRRTLGNKVGLAETTNIAGLVARDMGNYAHARELFEESLALWHELQRPRGVSVVLGNLGDLAAREGDFARALACFDEALELSWELGDSWTIARCLEGLGAVATRRGDIERAARLWGAAEALREAIGAPLPPNLAPYYEGLMAEARAQVEHRTWDAAWAAGRALSPEDAVALALR